MEVVEAPVEVVEKLVIRDVVLEAPLERAIQVLGFSVFVISVQLGVQARIAVNIKCSRGAEIYTEYKEVVLEGDEYTAWGADDKYILEIVKSKLPSWY